MAYNATATSKCNNAFLKKELRAAAALTSCSRSSLMEAFQQNPQNQ